MAWWNRRNTACLGCQAKDQELSRLRSCTGCHAKSEHIKDLQTQMIASRQAWAVERQEYKTAIDRLLAKEGQAPVGAMVPVGPTNGQHMDLMSVFEERTT